MSRILLAYSTVDGHTGTIAGRLQRQLEALGHSITLARIDDGPPADLRAFDTIVIGASVRYGTHRPQVHAFVRRNFALLHERPCAFFSVNLVARKKGKDSAQTNPYVKTFLRRTKWRPGLVAVFAGRLDYPKYGPLDRSIVRLIMWVTGGPTAPDARVEFTDWNAVASFGRGVASLTRAHRGDGTE